MLRVGLGLVGALMGDATMGDGRYIYISILAKVCICI